jgi:hypothetical protein
VTGSRFPAFFLFRRELPTHENCDGEMAMALLSLRRPAAFMPAPDSCPDASDAIPAHANSDTATDARAELAEQVTTALAVVVAVAIVCSIAMLLGTT